MPKSRHVLPTWGRCFSEAAATYFNVATKDTFASVQVWESDWVELDYRSSMERMSVGLARLDFKPVKVLKLTIEPHHAEPIRALYQGKKNITKADLLLIRRSNMEIVLRHELLNGFVTRQESKKTAINLLDRKTYAQKLLFYEFELQFEKVKKS